MDKDKILKDFPILLQEYNGKKMHYMDSAASSLTPEIVVNKISEYYRQYRSNVYRGSYIISNIASNKVEISRERIAKFLNTNAKNIVFTKGTTESINMLIYSYMLFNVKEGDVIFTSKLEHHAVIAPLQLLKEKGAIIKYIDLFENGEVDYKAISKDYFKGAKFLILTGASNVLGFRLDLKFFIKRAKEHNVKVFFDLAQYLPHKKIDLEELDADAVAFSMHKMLGPTGVGVLYAKTEILKEMKPFNYGGGEMISYFENETFYFSDPPQKMEAGTPDIASLYAICDTIDYLEDEVGFAFIEKREQELYKLFKEKTKCIEELKIISSNEALNMISFNLNGVHPHDTLQVLSTYNLCLRSGLLCARPLFEFLQNKGGCVRASLFFYNFEEDIEVLSNGIKEVAKVFLKK